jgi:uncharacterized membrane protein
MSISTKRRGLLLATTAAALFGTSGAMLAAEGHDAATAGQVHCMGINSCKGEGACASANNSCAGTNSCKGQGWLPVASAKECKEKGGTVVQ